MGLDMYLNKRTYIGAYYPHRDVTGIIDIEIGGNPIPIQMRRVSSIEEQIGYWRKANAIHGWFVENCANGVDNCEPVNVTEKKLNALLGLIEKAIKQPDRFHPELLPTPGFFFGDVEDLEWYHCYLNESIPMLERALLEFTEENATYPELFYRASW